MQSVIGSVSDGVVKNLGCPIFLRDPGQEHGSARVQMETRQRNGGRAHYRGAMFKGLCVVATTVVLGACGSGGGAEEAEAFCQGVVQYHDELGEADTSTPEALEATLERVNEVADWMKENAPSEISSELRTLLTSDPESRSASERKAYEASQLAVNEFLANTCQTDVRF